MPLPKVVGIDINSYGFTSSDLQASVVVAGIGITTVASAIEFVQRNYCGSIGFEFQHLTSDDARTWLTEQIESRPHDGTSFTPEQRINWLKKLVDAETFEAELHKKYVGHKRFSLEGGDALIPILDILIEKCADTSVREVIIGMAHRGRLNVLANTLGKPLEDIFSEFEDQNIFTSLGSEDVKYHLGYHSIYKTTSEKSVELHLAPNPSHLEFVNPVIEGIARAKQDLNYNGERSSVLAVQIHGDAAMAGQGVVPETLQLSAVEGYKTGGSIHIVVNNQVGFTTDPDDSIFLFTAQIWLRRLKPLYFT